MLSFLVVTRMSISKGLELLQTDFSKTFFFLPFVMDRSEDNVDLLSIDIEFSNFGEDFDPSEYDFDNANRERNRKL